MFEHEKMSARPKKNHVWMSENQFEPFAFLSGRTFFYSLPAPQVLFQLQSFRQSLCVCCVYCSNLLLHSCKLDLCEHIQRVIHKEWVYSQCDNMHTTNELVLLYTYYFDNDKSNGMCKKFSVTRWIYISVFSSIDDFGTSLLSNVSSLYIFKIRFWFRTTDCSSFVNLWKK
jgi:hypothetical protein